MAISQINYRFCSVEEDRVTAVNGRWTGSLPRDHEPAEEALESCPVVWDFLVRAGEEGWQLAAALPWALPRVADIRGKPKTRAGFTTALIFQR